VANTLSKTILRALVAVPISASLSGCVLLMASTVPSDRGTVLPETGMDRAAVVAKFGEPDWVTREKGAEVDSYKSAPDGPKPGRRLFDLTKIAIVDVATLGFTEGATLAFVLQRLKVGGVPYFVYEITYSSSNKVASVATITKQAWLPAE
jgi:hypothetical protein